MSDRSRRDGVSSDHASEQPSGLQEIAAELCSVGHEDTSASLGQRRPMEPLSFCQASATLGRQVASGLEVMPPATAPSPSEGTAVTTIEPRPSLVVCTVSFAPKIGGNLVESLSGTLREVYPYAAAPRGLAGPQVFYSDPDRNWAVWLTDSAIGLETSRFQALGEFQDRLGALVRFLDTGLYRRVGLRSVYHVPSSWNVVPKPLSPDQQHLGQVVQWRSHGGQSYFDLDVFAENVKSASLDAHLKEIFQASLRLASSGAASTAFPKGHRESARDGGDSAAAVQNLTITAVAAYPELVLVPPGDLLAVHPTEVDLVASGRAELLARKYSGQGLSPAERARLDELTARLDELLPPVSVQELEVLLGMAEEAERVRERAQERRRRLLELSAPLGA
jgi:hypothetical protein